MENQVPIQNFNQPTNITSGSIMQNIVIIILVIILLFNILGVNIISSIGEFIQKIIDIFNPVLSKTLSDLGYASGTLIDKSGDAVAEVSKTGIDIANGTLHSVGNLLVKASKKDLDQTIQSGPNNIKEPPKPDSSNSQIQNNKKSQWCLIGEYKQRRGCIEVGEQDKCLSGQIFPTEQICLNPTLSQNRIP